MALVLNKILSVFLLTLQHFPDAFLLADSWCVGRVEGRCPGMAGRGLRRPPWPRSPSLPFTPAPIKPPGRGVPCEVRRLGHPRPRPDQNPPCWLLRHLLLSNKVEPPRPLFSSITSLPASVPWTPPSASPHPAQCPQGRRTFMWTHPFKGVGGRILPQTPPTAPLAPPCPVL